MSARAQILRSNKNKPSKQSILYYLENTLEYLIIEKTTSPEGI